MPNYRAGPAKHNAPWIYGRGEPFKSIGALELFATLVAIVCFVPKRQAGEAKGLMKLTGTTDNQGNGHVISKLMTTSFPLNTVLMEVTEQLAARDTWLELVWTPRQQNEEADALTNGNYSDFTDENRIHIDVDTAPFLCLRDMMASGLQLYRDLDDIKEKAESKPVVEPKAKRRKPLKDRDPW